MPENSRDTLLDRRSPADTWLIVNETEAVVFAPPSASRDLYERFRNSGLPCSHLPGHCGADVIDFGNPSADEERRIRAVFAAWREDTQGKGGSSLWCVSMALLVVALWVVAMLASW
jgi:hypothetical protein